MDKTQYFATTAQVIPTLLVVFAVEARTLTERHPFPRLMAFLVYLMLGFAFLGEALAITALTRTAHDWFEPVISLAWTCQFAVILIIAMLRVAEARDAAVRDRKATPQERVPGRPPAKPSFWSLVALWFLLRRTR